MRIKYILSFPFPSLKACSIQAAHTAQAFSENGADVTLVCPGKAGKGVDAETDPRKFFGLRRELSLVRLNVPDYTRPADSAEFLRLSLGRVLCPVRTLHLVFSLRSSGLLNNPEEITYLRDVFLARCIQAVCGQKAGSRMFVEVHGLADNRAVRSYQIRALSRCAGVITLTGSLREILIREGLPPDKILAAPNGVDTAGFIIDKSKEEACLEIGLNQKRRYAAYIGRFRTLDREKGLHEIIEAADKLLSAYYDLDFLFVGGDVRQSMPYVKAIRQRDLDPGRFIFTQAAYVNIPVYLRASDVLLMPYPRTPRYDLYMSALKTFEYMASGRPTVGTGTGAIGEILRDGDTALLYEPGDGSGLVKAVASLLDNPGLSRKIGSNAREAARRYDWSIRGRRIIEFMNGAKSSIPA